MLYTIISYQEYEEYYDRCGEREITSENHFSIDYTEDRESAAYLHAQNKLRYPTANNILLINGDNYEDKYSEHTSQQDCNSLGLEVETVQLELSLEKIRVEQEIKAKREAEAQAAINKAQQVTEQRERAQLEALRLKYEGK